MKTFKTNFQTGGTFRAVFFAMFFLAATHFYGQVVKLDTTFIQTETIQFYDDFDGERLGEFPKKWLPVAGMVEIATSENTTETNTLLYLRNKAAVKPFFDQDSYLGDRFKIEMGIYFYGMGNEQYNLILKNGSGSKEQVRLRISAYGIKINNDDIVRYADGMTKGWQQVQLSFNQGNMKISVSGEQLINQPLIGFKEFQSVELHTINSSHKGRMGELAYFAIAEDAIPLYDRLMSDGKLVVQDIHFKVNSYQIEPESYTILDKIATMLSQHQEVKLSIEGHTDSDGSTESNQVLSLNRAKAVRDYLLGKSISAERLTAKGFGESKPLDMANTPEAKAKNRRVEFLIIK